MRSVRSGPTKLRFSVFLFVAFLLSIVARATFAAEAAGAKFDEQVAMGKKLCKNNTKGMQTVDSGPDALALEPCNEARLLNKGKDAAQWGAISHGAATAICAAEAFASLGNLKPPKFVCQSATAVAFGGDLAFAGRVIKDAIEQDQNFRQSVTQFAPMSTGLAVGTVGVTAAIGAATSGLSGVTSKLKACANSLWCLAGANLVVGGVMYYDIHKFKKAEENAYAKKAIVFDGEKAKLEESLKGNLEKGDAPAGGSPARLAGLSDPKANPNVTASSDSDVRSLAATATQDQRNLLSEFQRVTGANASEILDQLAANPNLDPAAAFLAPVAAKVSAEQQSNLANLVTASKGAGERNREFIERDPNISSRLGSTAFALTSKSSGGAGGEAMPDLGALFGAMMPKKEAAPQGANGPKFTDAAKNQANAEGFHRPEASLFDVVERRYQMVSQRFLEGEGVVREPASLVPKNIYLSK